jgi:hypothetical protein
MNPTLERQVSQLNRRQKLALANRLLADAGLHARPPALRDSADAKLEAEVRRRLSDKRPDAWMTLAEFRGSTGLR